MRSRCPFVTGSNDEQAFLMEVNPAVYFITDHYRGGRAVLARIADLTPEDVRARLKRGWEVTAPPAVLKAAAKAAAP